MLTIRNALVVTTLALATVTMSACCFSRNYHHQGDREATAQADTKRERRDPSLSPMDALKAHYAELAAEPEHTDSAIQVQHLLIGFKLSNGDESVPGKNSNRNYDQAESLVADLFAKINAGADFNELVSQYTQDSAPGIYGMALDGTTAPSGYFHRGMMVAAFGNVGWKLGVGEVGVAAYDKMTSPYGWHIIKRLK